jgi:hypothetical protein
MPAAAARGLDNGGKKVAVAPFASAAASSSLCTTTTSNAKATNATSNSSVLGEEEDSPDKGVTAAAAPGAVVTLMNWDVFYALTVYFVVPVIALHMSTWYQDNVVVLLLAPSKAGGSSSNNNDSVSSFSSSLLWHAFLVQHPTLLTLGYSTSARLWSRIWERIESAACWGLCFLYVRKALNPECWKKTKKDQMTPIRTNAPGGEASSPSCSVVAWHSKYWRGAVLSTLSVLYSSTGRMLLKHNSTAVARLCQARPLCDAALVGLSWGLSNVLIRRRLDPALSHNLLSRCWKDLICGSCSLSVTSYLSANYGLLRLWTIAATAMPAAALQQFWSMRLQYLAKPLALDCWGWWQQAVVISVFHHAFGLDSTREIWLAVLRAGQVGLYWALPYLLIRRGCNPDSHTISPLRSGRRTKTAFLSKWWRDTMYGSIALFVYVFLRLAVQHWTPMVLSGGRRIMFGHETAVQVEEEQGGNVRDDHDEL